MALAKDVNRKSRDGTGRNSADIANTEVVYRGSLLAAGSISHATAANQGRLLAYTGAAGEIPLGHWAKEGETGDSTASPIPEAEWLNQPKVLRNVAVTGAAGTAADAFKTVYASDDDTFTLTRPTRGLAIGYVLRSRSATDLDLQLFSADQIYLLSLAGAAQEVINFGSIDGTNADTADGNQVTGWECPYHGRILSTWGNVVTTFAGTTGDAIALNFEINGTNMTGGVVTFTAADALGTKQAGTSVTALNVFHEGELIDIESVFTGTGMTAGWGTVHGLVEKLPGL